MTDHDKRPTISVSGALALSLLIGMATGCSTLETQFEQPTVKLASLALLEASMSRQVYSVRLEVDNPNGYPLPVRAINYNVRLAQQDFASGSTSNAFSIPANGSDSIDLQVRTNLIESISTLARLLQGGASELDYQLSGDIKINLPFVSAVPFSQSGKIPLTMQ